MTNHRADRPAERTTDPKDLSKLMEQSVSTLQEVDKRLQMVRTDLANLITRAAQSQPGGGPPGAPFGLPGGFGAAPAQPVPYGGFLAAGIGPAGPPPLAGPQALGGAQALPGQRPGIPGLPARESLPAVQRIPSVDLVDEGESFVIHVELPGVKKDDLDLTVSDRMVQVRATAQPEVGEGSVVLLSERAPVLYERIIPFPADVATNKCKANFKDGILTLAVPKKQPGEGPRKVDVAYG